MCVNFIILYVFYIQLLFQLFFYFDLQRIMIKEMFF